MAMVSTELMTKNQFCHFRGALLILATCESFETFIIQICICIQILSLIIFSGYIIFKVRFILSILLLKQIIVVRVEPIGKTKKILTRNLP